MHQGKHTCMATPVFILSYIPAFIFNCAIIISALNSHGFFKPHNFEANFSARLFSFRLFKHQPCLPWLLFSAKLVHLHVFNCKPKFEPTVYWRSKIPGNSLESEMGFASPFANMHRPRKVPHVVLFRTRDKEYLLDPSPGVFDDGVNAPGNDWLHLTTTFPNFKHHENHYFGFKESATSVPQRPIFIAMGFLVEREKNAAAVAANQCHSLRRTTNYGVPSNFSTEPILIWLAWNYHTLDYDYDFEPIVHHLHRLDLHNPRCLDAGECGFRDDFLPDDLLITKDNSQPIIHNIQTLMSVRQTSYSAWNRKVHGKRYENFNHD